MKFRSLLLFGSVVLSITAVVLFFPMWSERVGGKRYDPSKPRDLSEIRRIIYSVQPLQSTLGEYHQQHRTYPEKLDALTMKQKHYLEEMAGTGYGPRILSLSREGSGYQLYIKLGWDPALYYHSASDEWVYDPGDGSATTVIVP